MNMITIAIDPMGAVRQTQADRWKKRPAVLKYRSFRDKIRQKCIDGGFELGESFEILFYIAMPESWSKKKKERMFMQPHNQKPDIDNLIKSVMDALKKDDKKVWKIKALKSWHTDGFIYIYNNEATE